jgi:predicted transposase YbfD/YdcC
MISGHPTCDLDLLSAGAPSVQRLEEVFRQLCGEQVKEDGLTFLASSVTGEQITEEDEYEGIRIRGGAKLGNPKTPLQIDIGFGDTITPGPLEIEYPPLLDFPAPKLLAYNRETVVAETFQAMVCLGMANRRFATKAPITCWRSRTTNRGCTKTSWRRLWTPSRANRGETYQQRVTNDKGHDREERREYVVVRDLSKIRDRELWPDLHSLAMVCSERTIDGKTSTETRYYISSCSDSVRQIAEAIRGHWGIEHSLHWSLDVTFGEDAHCLRKDHGPEIMATLRRTAPSLVKQERIEKGSLPRKRLRAGWNNAYLEKLLNCGS